MKVPLLDLKPQLSELRDEIITGVTSVIDSTRYIQGPEVESLEKEIAGYTGVSFGIGVSSGTDALLVALMSLDIGEGDLVLTTPFSFFATMGVILRLGAVPVFADIDPVTYNIDPDNVEEILDADAEKRIKAVIPVHLYGQCADMERLCSIAEKYNVFLIEDAAQAIGSEVLINYNGGKTWRRAGSLGIAGCFSFFPSKNLGGIGDGGMVVTDDKKLAEKIALLRNHGAYPKYYHALVGGNFRLDPIQATVLRIKLKHLENWHAARRKNADCYNDLFKKSSLLEKSLISIPEAVYGNITEADGNQRNYHIYNQYVIRVKDRDQLREWLSKKDVGTEIYYPLALHQQECVKNLIKLAELPHAETAARETLALPIFPELTQEMQEYVVACIEDFYA